MDSICVYYGDCPFNYRDCQEDEPWHLCNDRKIKQVSCSDCSCEILIQPCEACENNVKRC